MRVPALTLIASVALVLAGPTLRADPNKDESGKGREKRDERGGGEREKELRKDVDEANRELRKAEEERDRELDKARDEARREGKPEKFEDKRASIWAKFREKEAKIRGKMEEKHGRAFARDYDGPREEYRRLPEGWDDDDDVAVAGGRVGRRGDRVEAGRGGEWVKYAQVPPAVKRTLDRERGANGVKKIVRDGWEGGRETYRAIIDRKGDDRVVVIAPDGRLIDDFRTADVRVERR